MRWLIRYGCSGAFALYASARNVQRFGLGALALVTAALEQRITGTLPSHFG
jgi:hypothetical protein